MKLEKIIPEIHTLTTGIYYKELQELLDYIVKMSYKKRENYKVICKEIIYRECKKIADYFNLEVLISNVLPDDCLLICLNYSKIAGSFTKYILQ